LVAVTYGGGSAGSYAGFDALGRSIRKLQQTDSVNYLVEASYNVSDAMTSETYPSVSGAADRRTVTFGFDTAGRRGYLNSNATSYAPLAAVTNITYASHGALNTETLGNGLIHTASYNNRLQPTEIKLGTSSNSTSIVDLTYSYGTTSNNGNVQSISYNGGGLSYTQTFSYDSLNRLQTAQENSGSSWSQTNGYDRYGNRWIDLGGGNQSLYFNTSDNRISGWSYDASGNLLNDGNHTYTFDAEGKILKVDGTTAYAYDGEGHRVRKLVGENTRFVYGIGGQLVAEFDGSNGNLKKEYVYGGATLITIEPTAANSNGTQYVTGDHLGSPRVITNASASVVSRHDYLPFGEELFAGTGGRTTAMGYGASDGIRKKFTQYERDAETGLDFAQARYYSNTQGRFTSPDPFAGSATIGNPQTFNRYVYVGNNPVNASDPTGMSGGAMFSMNYMDGRDLGGKNHTSYITEREDAEKDYEERLQNTRDAIAANDAYQRGGPNDPTYKALMAANPTLVAVPVLSKADKAALNWFAGKYGQGAVDQLLFNAVAALTGLSNYMNGPADYDPATRTFSIDFKPEVEKFLASSPYFAGPGIALLHLDVGTFDYRSYTDMTGELSLQLVLGNGRNIGRSYGDFDKINPYQDLVSFVRHNVPIIFRRIGRIFK
jgi:RHS repeat-associated protein